MIDFMSIYIVQEVKHIFIVTGLFVIGSIHSQQVDWNIITHDKCLSAWMNWTRCTVLNQIMGLLGFVLLCNLIKLYKNLPKIPSCTEYFAALNITCISWPGCLSFDLHHCSFVEVAVALKSRLKKSLVLNQSSNNHVFSCTNPRFQRLHILIISGKGKGQKLWSL